MFFLFIKRCSLVFVINITVYFEAEYNQLSHRKYVDTERFTFVIRNKR